MKIILSRKGFDSSNGRMPSPVFEDGTLVSFPIPSRDYEKDCVRYDELIVGDHSLNDILTDLNYSGSDYCHMDPDLRNMRKSNINSWIPAFGQINQSASYLLNNNISEGDLFLFFGNFHHVEVCNGKFKYIKRTKQCIDDFQGRDFQVIWGYLQVGKIVRNPEEQKQLYWHPHSCEKRLCEINNLIFTATDNLSFKPELSGCGIFNYDRKRILTLPNASKATWLYNDAYAPYNIVGNRKNSSRKENGIYYSGIWQELMLKDNSVSEEWAKSIFD